MPSSLHLHTHGKNDLKLLRQNWTMTAIMLSMNIEGPDDIELMNDFQIVLKTWHGRWAE